MRPTEGVCIYHVIKAASHRVRQRIKDSSIDHIYLWNITLVLFKLKRLWLFEVEN